MKSFTAFAFAASLALTSAQVTSNPDGTFTCAIPDAAYCAGDSLNTNIIIRCIGTVGQPGNCNDNLAGEFPRGVNFAPCWQPSATSGQAACSKNCIVYGGSGNYSGNFALPNCTPATTSSVSTTATATTTSTSTSPVVPSYTTIVNAYTTVTVPCVSGSPVPPTTTAPLTIITLTTGGSGPSSSAPGPLSNSTVTTSANNAGSATAIPVGPTTTSPASFTGGAVANQAGGVLAVAGLLVAYFL